MNSSPRHLARSIRLALATAFVLGCVLALPALASASTYVVNTLGDEYNFYGCQDETECTLRTAISKANETDELDTIEFAVEGPIELEEEPLPPIYHPVEIDATTIPGYTNKPKVEIDGTNAQSEGATEGLSFLAGAGGSRVEGLAIGGFEIGVYMAGESSIYLCASFIGLSADGVTATPNVVGVETGFHVPAQKIGSECWEHGGNRIDANSQYGIVDFGTGTKIAQNTIGLDVNDEPLPNGTAFGAGILVSSSAEHPYIGGFPGEEGEPGNVIADNAGSGILVENAASNVSIRRNRIYGNTEAAIKFNAGTKTPAPLVEYGLHEGEGFEAFGTLHAKPEHGYVIDIFASASCYENSVGEGEYFLGSTEVTTDSGGQGIFDEFGLNVPPEGAEFLSGTATDLETGSTSVIGLCVDPPPFTEFTSVPEDPLDSTSASFEFEGDDPNGSVAYFQCSLDGGGFGTCSSPKELTGLEQGQHTYEVRAVDQVGLPDFSPATYTWTVDTVDPAVELESTPSDPSNSTSAIFEFTAADSGSGIDTVECSLDQSAFTPCSSPVEYTGLSDGVHEFEVQAFDKADHSTVESFEWTVDATAPTTTLESKPSNPSTDTAPSLTFSGADPGGTGVAAFECKLDGGSFGVCTSPEDLDGLEEGSHTFEVRARDNAGNVDASPASYTWTVDTVAPDTSIDTQPANPSTETAPSFSFSGDDGAGTGVASFECKLDAGAFASCTSPKALSGLADGSHTFQVRAKDGAGNTDQSPASYTWVVDTTAPATTLESKPTNPSTSTAPSLTFSGADSGGTGVSAFECKLDGGSFGVCTSPDNLSGLEDGSHTFEVRAVDAVGNKDATPAAYTWTVDATAPTTTLESKPSNPSNNTGPSFTFSGADGGTGVASFECKLDGGSFALCSSPKSFAGLGNGSHTFEVRAKDNAGNADPSPAAYTWAIDTTVPSPPELTETDPDSPANENAPTVIGDAPPGTTVSLFETANCSGTPAATATAVELELGIEVTVPDDAVTQFSANATSAALVTSACSDPLAYREDSTPPSTQIESPTPAGVSKSNSASFFFSGSDAGGSGVASFECRLEDRDFAPCTSPQDFTGLADGSHTFEVRAIDKAGNGDPSPETFAWRVDTSTEPPPVTSAVIPSNGESVAVAPEGGKVFVLRPGDKKPTQLKEGETIPVGSIVDATIGKVLLTSVNAAGEEQSAYFFGGKFLIQQHDGSGLVILKLRGGDLSSCGDSARKSGATTSGRKGRKLWGSGHGNFRTEGSYGSATVRGTIWLTEDRCEGTYFKTRRGVVSVKDFTNGKTISLPAGKTYFAQP